MTLQVVLNLLAVIAGMGVLWTGGELLVRCSARLGLRLGLSSMVVGLTIVAFATSAPELAVTLDAAVNGLPDMATGNVVGSNICNLALVLGATALILPVRTERRVWRRDIPLMLLVYLVVLLMFGNRLLERLEGLLLLSLLLAFIASELRGSRSAARTAAATPLAPAAGDVATTAPVDHSVVPVWRDLLGIATGVALLAAGSQLLVWGAATLARHAGVSDAVVGLTLVAFGTSLPELATSLAAAIRNRPELAVGNLIGSNIFNSLGVMGTAAVITPLTAQHIQPRDYLVMFLVAVLVWALARLQARVGRLGGALLTGGYLGYFGVAMI